jgi:hypothetical protein
LWHSPQALDPTYLNVFWAIAGTDKEAIKNAERMRAFNFTVFLQNIARHKLAYRPMTDDRSAQSGLPNASPLCVLFAGHIQCDGGLGDRGNGAILDAAAPCDPARIRLSVHAGRGRENGLVPYFLSSFFFVVPT